MLCYNIKGMERVANKKEFYELTKHKKPNLVCVQETKFKVVEETYVKCCGDQKDLDFSSNTKWIDLEVL